MPFEYCCFISYPHGHNDVLVPRIEDFVAGLEQEIYAVSRKKIWVDVRNLQGGSRLNGTIGPELCKSACMILIYTPLYFDAEHTYCARELTAMHQLEEQRMKLLGDPGNGLIIPIILRGKKEFPKVLQDRGFHDFTDILLSNPDDKIRVKHAEKIKKIAEYVIERCNHLEKVAPHLTQDCQEFRLPSSEDAKKFVEQVLEHEISDVAVPFVLRSSKSASM